jgi:tetratricopeptide (TPR) repeat protein
MRVFAIAVAICVASGAAAAQPKKPKPAPRGQKKPPEPPPSPEKLRADKLFEDGRRYLAAKEYALACTAFEQSQAADPAIGTQLNIALCYEEWGKPTAAYRAYLEAERLAKDKKDDRERGARLKVDQLAPKVPHLQVEIPADADVATVFMLDGNEIDRAKLQDDLLVEPGKHVIVARVPGRPAKETVVDLREGERKKITIDVPRPKIEVIVKEGARKKNRFYGGIGLTAGGGIALGVAGFVSLVARQDYADAVIDCPDRQCTSREAFDATQSARKKATLMTFVGAGGVVMAGAGLYLILTSRGPRTTERKVTLSPMLGTDGGGLVVGGRL